MNESWSDIMLGFINEWIIKFFIKGILFVFIFLVWFKFGLWFAEKLGLI